MSSHTFEKSIDPAAIQLMQNILQISQYIYPQRSTMRELVSNGVDSVEEKQVALSILKGKARVEDYYLPRTDGIYKDSGFDAAYYDQQWLSPYKLVEVEYHNNGNLERDKIVIRDHGVGLWGKRLAGYFNLGYSTKRNSKFALGKFGIGAKSALSTGAPFFTMTSCHNGRKTSFNVYSSHIEPVTPPKDLVRGVDNMSFELPTGNPDKPMVCYYEPTTEKNGVTIEVAVKKHHKSLYLDAVKLQLMYFDHVKLVDVTGNNKAVLEFKPQILFENDFMVISENSLYNKPHLIIDKVNYGDIDFTELELEEKKGNVGLKVRAEQVTVNPSRESVIWDDMTKQAILDVYQRMVATASELIEKELNQEDFWGWTRACTQAANQSYRGQNSILTALGSFVDFGRVAPRFKPRPEISAGHWIIECISWTKVQTVIINKGSEQRKKLIRDNSVLRMDLIQMPIVRRREASDARKNKYLSSVVYPNGYIELVIPEKYVPLHAPGEPAPPAEYRINFGQLALEDFKCSIYRYRKVPLMEDYKRGLIIRPHHFKTTREDHDAVHNAIQFIYAALDTEPSFVDYDTVQVPATFKVSEKEDEEDIVENTTPVQQQVTARGSAAERRKLTGTIPIYGLFQGIKAQFEVTPAAVDGWQIDHVYVSSFNDIPLMQLAQQICGESVGFSKAVFVKSEGLFVSSRYSSQLTAVEPGVTKHSHFRIPEVFFESDTRLMLVGEKYHKYFRDFKDISLFFQDIQKDTITMSHQLKHFNTARIINTKLEEMEYLQYFNGINSDLSLAWQGLYDYTKSYRVGHIQDEDLLEYLGKVSNLQLFVRQNPDQHEAIVAMVSNMFGDPGDVRNADAIELPRYDLTNELEDMLTPVHNLLKYLDWETHYKDPAFIQEVRNFINERNANILFTYKPVQ